MIYWLKGNAPRQPRKPKLNNIYVLDSFAVLALLNDEAGAARVEELLRQASKGEAQVFISLINLGEVLYIVERRWGEERLRSMLAYLDSTALKITEVERKQVLAAVHIKAHHPLSFADAFCVALAREMNATILTSDVEFNTISSLVPIEWLPRKAQS
jgi:ribonuclease VapC